MSESTAGGEFLTISEAAKVLGISERQARRYARRLEDGDRQVLGEAGHGAGHASGLSPARVRLAAMVEARAKATGGTQSTVDERETSTEGTPDTRPAQAGHEAGHVLPEAGRDAGHVTALLSQKDAHIEDLRRQVTFLQERNAELNAIIMRHAHALPMPPQDTLTTDGTTTTATSNAAQKAVQRETRHADRVGLRGWLLRLLRG